MQVVRRPVAIASLQDRLDRQERLLDQQQQQITKLTATLNELMDSLKISRKASTQDALARSALPAAPPRAEPASVRTENVLAHPPAEATAGVEPLDLNLLAGLQAPIFSLLTDSEPFASFGPSTPFSSQSSLPATPQAPQDQTQPYTTRLENLSKEVEGISKGIAGFRFSGDLRLRSDNVFRSSSSVAGPVQNARGTYRARINLDKGIDNCLDVHFQLGSGRFDNPLTDDTDFGSLATRGPIFLTEAWADYHPNAHLSVRGGKMPEVFQDFTRLIWDEDVRFNGFQESLGTSPGDNPLGVTRIDFRAGQYVLTSPNIQVLPSAAQCSASSAPASCAYLEAGYQPGQNVRASDLFDQGIFVNGRIKPGWSQYVYSNFLLFRNPDQIALASTSSGFPLLVSNVLGATLVGPLPGTGTATTLPGGGIYTAKHFQIGHAAYRLTKEGLRLRDEDFPVFVDIQASRNFGTCFLRNAWMVTLNAGDIKKGGDVRFLYLYGEKDADSMISQFTDDHVGSLTGVNIRTHSFRVDVGLTRFLQWQNILYIQNEISSSNPARHFYVPVPAGTPTLYRVESSLFVNF